LLHLARKLDELLFEGDPKLETEQDRSAQDQDATFVGRIL
jgi:hypothetical protein